MSITITIGWWLAPLLSMWLSALIVAIMNTKRYGFDKEGFAGLATFVVMTTVISLLTRFIP